LARIRVVGAAAERSFLLAEGAPRAPDAAEPALPAMNMLGIMPDMMLDMVMA
jgi:hypothetical protein